MIESAQIPMTRAEAEQAFNALGDGMKACVTNLKAIGNKRSWRDSEKAMACIPFRTRLAAFEMLRNKIGEAFHIGGY